MIAIVDYGRGNLFSLSQALSHVGARHEIVDDPRGLEAADALILPGVGAFGDAAEALRNRDMFEPIRRLAAAGRPLLGICVGCQLLMGVGEEFGEHEGLGLLPGRVRRLPAPERSSGKPARIPNIGWRPIRKRGEPACLRGAYDGGMVYFVHSFAPQPDDPADVAATIEFNGIDVAAAVERGNVAGLQFHPEKSADLGLSILRDFASFRKISRLI
jgi:glutamine amidotransferase